MRIIIAAPTYKLLNFGDTTMITACVGKLIKLFPGADISIFTEDPEKINNLFSNSITPIHIKKPDPRFREIKIFPKILFKTVPYSGKLKLEGLEVHLLRKLPEGLLKIIRAINIPFKKEIYYSNIYKEITKTDMVVVSGGGFLTDSFFKISKRVLMTMKLASKLGKITVMFGQGIGPVLDKKLIRLIKDNLQYVNIIGVREKKFSFDLLKSLGFDSNKIRITGDDTIELANRKENSIIGKNIGINVRTAYYANIDNKEKNDLSSFVIEMARARSVDIVSLPILSETKLSDIITMRKLFSKYEKFRDIDINYNEIDKLLGRINDCRVVITASYHGGVFALSNGIPVIGLAKSSYYKYKFEGLADMFGKGCYVIPLYKKGYVSLLNESFEEAWENAEMFRENLLLSAKKQIKMNRSAYAEIADLAKEKLVA